MVKLWDRHTLLGMWGSYARPTLRTWSISDGASKRSAAASSGIGNALRWVEWGAACLAEGVIRMSIDLRVVVGCRLDLQVSQRRQQVTGVRGRELLAVGP